MGNAPETNPEAQRHGEKLAKLLASLYYEARRDYGFDLTHRAIRVLQFISFAKQTPCIDEVARFLGSAASTASELMTRMQKKGFVRRRRAEDDERVVRLELTDSGREALAEHTSVDPERLARGLRSLTPREQDELTRILGRVIEEIRKSNPKDS